MRKRSRREGQVRAGEKYKSGEMCAMPLSTCACNGHTSRTKLAFGYATRLCRSASLIVFKMSQSYATFAARRKLFLARQESHARSESNLTIHAFPLR
jgi:hypothetical protein